MQLLSYFPFADNVEIYINKWNEQTLMAGGYTKGNNIPL